MNILNYFKIYFIKLFFKCKTVKVNYNLLKRIYLIGKYIRTNYKLISIKEKEAIFEGAEGTFQKLLKERNELCCLYYIVNKKQPIEIVLNGLKLTIIYKLLETFDKGDN